MTLEYGVSRVPADVDPTEEAQAEQHGIVLRGRQAAREE